MKKIVIALAALALTAGIASAQDINAALETYNTALSLVDSDKAAALDGLKEALKQGEALGDEGAELVGNCKNAIPSLMLSMSKSLINDGEFDKALESLEATEAVAKEYDNPEVLLDIPGLMSNVYNRRGSKLFNEKNFEAALADFAKVIEDNPEDGQTHLKMGIALQSLGKVDEAIDAYKLAAANGKEKQANPKLANIFKKKAIAAQKANKPAEAIEALEASNQYVEDAGNYRSIGGLYTKIGKRKEAIAAYIKYLELNPTAGDADGVKYTIAVNAKDLGDKATAKAYYTQLLGSANPDYAAEAKKQVSAL